MKSFAPSAALSPFVLRFEIVEATHETTRTLLPERGLIVGLRYAGSAELLQPSSARVMPTRSLAGIRGSARRMRTAAGSALVVAKLRGGCAGRFFAVPAHELFDDTYALDQLLPASAVDRAQESVATARTHEARVRAFEHFLLSMARPWQPDRVVQHALCAIDATGGAVRIAQLASDSGLSQDAFEKRFRRSVGATPKQLASVVRLRRAIAAWTPSRSLTEVSLEAGYADQSHFIRDFRRMTGAAPRTLLRGGDYC